MGTLSVHHAEIAVRTRGEVDIIDLTERVQAVVKGSGIRDGLVSVFNPGSTGSITTLEFEPGVVEDVRRALEQMASRKLDYRHNQHDDNGHSHVRAAILGPGVSLPLRKGTVILGKWQQVVFVELDTQPRDRTILVDIVGE